MQSPGRTEWRKKVASFLKNLEILFESRRPPNLADTVDASSRCHLASLLDNFEQPVAGAALLREHPSKLSEPFPENIIAHYIFLPNAGGIVGLEYVETIAFPAVMGWTKLPRPIVCKCASQFQNMSACF